MWKRLFVLVLALALECPGWCSGYGDVQHRAQELVKSGKKQEAAELLERAIGQDDSEDAEWLRGSILIWRNAPAKQVLTQYRKVADRFPASPRAAVALLRVGHLRDKAGEDSTPDWQRIVTNYPHTNQATIALHSLGHRALSHNDPSLAITMFGKAAEAPEADPSSAAESRVEAGYATISLYWKTKEKTLLEDARKEFLSLKPLPKGNVSTVRAHLGLGETFLIEGAAADAVREYQAALAEKPTHPYLMGIAEFGLASSLYTKRDFVAAQTAFSQFLDQRKGASLAEKNRLWKNTRPGFDQGLVSGMVKGGGFGRADLVLVAAYWKAASLVETRRYREAIVIIDELKQFPGDEIAARTENLRKICSHMLGEDR